MAVLRTYRMEGSEQASGSGWQMAVHRDDLKRVTERWSERSESLLAEAGIRVEGKCLCARSAGARRERTRTVTKISATIHLTASQPE